MVTGLMVVWRGRGRAPGWLDFIAKASVIAGLLLSAYEFTRIIDPF